MKSNPFIKARMIEYVYIYIGYNLELLQVMLGYRLQVWRPLGTSGEIFLAISWAGFSLLTGTWVAVEFLAAIK